MHEYSLARGAAIACLLGYGLDLLAAAPMGLFTFVSVATFVLARAAGVRLAAQHIITQMPLALFFSMAQSVMILVLLAIFSKDPQGAKDMLPLVLPHAISTALFSPSRVRNRRSRPRHDWHRGPREACCDMSMLVQRPDMGEFRKRPRWLALAAITGLPDPHRAPLLFAGYQRR